MIAFYHQTKIPINFWCRQKLNLRSLIEPSEILSVELNKTHNVSETKKLFLIKYSYLASLNRLKFYKAKI